MMTHNIHDNISQWMKSNEETPIVMSSRIRLARNLENHVHPQCMLLKMMDLEL